MVRAELRGNLYCSDHDPIEEWVPDDSRTIDISLLASIGSSGERGEDDFQFVVRTPGWYLQEWTPIIDGAKSPDGERSLAQVWGFRTIIIPYWDYGLVRSIIEDLCQTVEGRNWNEVASKLSRYGAWEFDPVMRSDSE